MPFLVPLIPAAVGAIAGNAISSAGRSSDQEKAQAQAQAQGAQAQQNAQNALTNTPQVQAATTAQQQQAAFAQAAGAQNGLQNQSQVYNAFGDVANGQGPNPAQAMLAQQTGQNVNNQAALMAGQRGAGANAGLLARQVGQQGAAIQQNAVGQGASLQAQQSLNALGQQAGIAGQQVGQQQNALNSSAATAANNQGAALGTLNQANAIQGQLANTNLSGANSQNQQGQSFGNDLTKGAIGGVGTGIASLMKAEGGEIEANGPKSMLAKHLLMAKGGKVPALVSPGERIIEKKDVKAVAEGRKNPMQAGRVVPGKAKVAGAKNSYANDTVPAKLEEGSIVLPRSVTQAKNPHWAAHQFVSKIMAQNGLPTRKPKQ